MRQRDIIITRNESGEIEVNFHREIVNGSPSGFEIGFMGSGPTDLALNILHRFLPPGKTPFVPTCDKRGCSHTRVGWTADAFENNAGYEAGRVVCTQGICSTRAFELRCAFRDAFLVDLHLANGQRVTLQAGEIAAWIDRQDRQEVHHG